jgi:prefoldin subunit 5
MNTPYRRNIFSRNGNVCCSSLFAVVSFCCFIQDGSCEQLLVAHISPTMEMNAGHLAWATQSKDKGQMALLPIENDKSGVNQVSVIPAASGPSEDKPAGYPDWVDQPIHGLHPVKKMLQPIIHLEKNSTELQKQILRLEGPIAGLQSPMLGLHKKMTSVDTTMKGIESELSGMQGRINGLEQHMISVEGQMHELRKDLSAMHAQIRHLEEPIRQLRNPINGVAFPLTKVRQELLEVKSLIAAVLFAIMVAAAAISIGTPIAAILVYQNRRRIFPSLTEHDLPLVRDGDHKGIKESSELVKPE